MAFLDNSGDIILDAVLTDTGRFRLAKGDGSFKIAKFALGDDEINYESYDKNNPSGSAYYDLEILQTPVLESFTNNTSTMKSKLISIPRTNLLYLPVMRLSGDGNGTMSGSTEAGAPRYEVGTFVVAVDQNTVGTTNSLGLLNASGSDALDTSIGRGVLNGFEPNSSWPKYIRADQGLDTTEIPPSFSIDADLRETQYIIEVDNRLGSIVSVGGTTPGLAGVSSTFVAASVSFIDDDNIASYYLSTNDTDFVGNVEQGAGSNTTQIDGPRGTGIQFKIQASTELATSTYLFEQLGSTTTMARDFGGDDISIRYIDSIIKLTGATTGYRIDIPVRFAKKV